MNPLPVVAIAGMVGVLATAARADACNAPWTAQQPTRAGALYDDLQTHTWMTAVAMFDTGETTISGRMPRALAMSIAVYSKDSRLHDHIDDTSILTSSDGAYEVRVLAGDPPATNRPPNTIYSGADNGGPNRFDVLAYRVTRPVDAADPTGDAGLPDVTFTPAAGDAVSIPSGGCAVPPTPAAPEEPPPPLPAPSHAGPTAWRLIFDPVDLALRTDAAPAADAVALGLQTTGYHQPRGFVDPQVAAIAASAALPGGDALVLRGRAPTRSQVRAWSLCDADAASTRTLACVDDSGVVLNGSGDYTVVLARDSNQSQIQRSAPCATILPWEASDQGVVVVGQRLADAGFAQAIARIPGPGDEASVMGSYLPSAEIVSLAALGSVCTS